MHVQRLKTAAEVHFYLTESLKAAVQRRALSQIRRLRTEKICDKNVTEYIYSSVFCYLILPLHYILEGNSVLFTPLRLFDNFSYKTKQMI